MSTKNNILTATKTVFMKAIHVLPILLLFGCAKCQPVPYPSSIRGASVNDTAYVLLLTGQSNANSHGGNLSSYFTGPATGVIQWDTTAKTFQAYSAATLALNGFNVQTALRLDSLRLDSVHCLKAAVGSLAITNWSNNGGSMQKFVDSTITQSFRYLRANGKVVKFLGVLWVQGEQDAVQGTAIADYQARLDSVVSRFRRLDAATSTAPWLLVKLTVGSGGGGYAADGVTNVNTAMSNVASAKTNVSTVAPESIGVTLSDTVHYTGEGYILLANYWYSYIKTFFNW